MSRIDAFDFISSVSQKNIFNYLFTAQNNCFVILVYVLTHLELFDVHICAWGNASFRCINVLIWNVRIFYVKLINDQKYWWNMTSYHYCNAQKVQVQCIKTGISLIAALSFDYKWKDRDFYYPIIVNVIIRSIFIIL